MSAGPSAGRPTSERRSPAALRREPPVERFELVSERPLTGLDLLDLVRERGGFDAVRWDRVLRHGGLHVEGHRIDPEAPPRLVAAGSRVVAYCFLEEPLGVELPDDAVLLDEDGVVAVDKPAGLTVQGTRASRLCSLERLLRERTGRPRLTPAHRLDRETSGVVLFAGTREAASALGRAFRRREVAKEYLAVVSPAPEADRFEATGWLVRASHPAHSLFALVAEPRDGARWSRTLFDVVERGGRRALLRARPETGRTHQLRVHLAATGSPIVGDSLYGAGWCPGEPCSASRLQLHAHSIRVPAAGSARELSVSAPPPADFGLGAG